ncbi:MAG: putative SnoG [Parcubacteria group bacterium Greene0714_36]|nr:MAG: putative SnoG [Parcubacteria group bacterium Greene0714_36]
MNNMKTITRCRSCESRRIRRFFDLGAQPPANSLPDNPNAREKHYPLSLSRCMDCGLIQLNETVDPRLLFSHYLWVTGTSGAARAFAEQFSRACLARAGDMTARYVLEIASNDGTFLLPFQKKGYAVLGVDPAKNLVALARRLTVPTECVFFGKYQAERIRARRGAAGLVIARNVVPHVANTRDFVAGLAAAVHEEGVVAVEAHYAKIMLEELHYDSIYHEHLCYFTFKTLERLLNEFGLFVFDATRSPISGGSIVAYASRIKRPERVSVRRLRAMEAKAETNSFSSWRNFAGRAREHRQAFISLLWREARAKRRIVGYGASARSSTLLNFCGIDRRMIEAIADQNPLKHGRWTAGSHIPIKDPAEIFAMHPDAVCILAWNFKDEIMRNARHIYGYRGPFIVPLPFKPARIPWPTRKDQ